MASTFPRRTRVAAAVALIVALAGAAPPASAFCGFYVGKADAKLFNEASQVILARDGNRTVISMRNDFQGELTDFALVVPGSGPSSANAQPAPSQSASAAPRCVTSAMCSACSPATSA